MAKATLFLLIAVAAGLLVYLLVAPKFARDASSSHGMQLQSDQPPQQALPSNPDSNSDRPSSSKHAGSAAENVDNAPSIDVPLSNERRSQQDLEARRGPLYDWIRTNIQMLLVGWQPSTSDEATLNLYMANADSADADITVCFTKLVQPYATKYGFNHVTFLVRNPPSESDPWRLDSEATSDANGAWHLYKK
jgi:hypothetical protein